MKDKRVISAVVAACGVLLIIVAIAYAESLQKYIGVFVGMALAAFAVYYAQENPIVEPVEHASASQDDMPPRDKPEPTICPQCGAENRPGANCCCRCGARLTGGVCYCPQCQRIYRGDIKYCDVCGVTTWPGYPPKQASYAESYSSKSWLVALLLCLFVGLLGVHRFYTGKIGTGILWLLTVGCFGIGWLVDLIMIACGSYKDCFGRPLSHTR